jgi:hypothetical protein
MSRKFKIIEGEGADSEDYGEWQKEAPPSGGEDNASGDPEVGEEYTFHTEDGGDVEFNPIKEVHHKDGKIIFKDDESQAVIEEDK